MHTSHSAIREFAGTGASARCQRSASRPRLAAAPKALKHQVPRDTTPRKSVCAKSRGWLALQIGRALEVLGRSEWMRAAWPEPGHERQSREGFSQVDLLTVIGVLLLLGFLLTPALARTRSADQAFVCRSNLGRLLAAWRMYVEDNSDKVPSAWANPGDWWPVPGMSWTGNPTTDGNNQYNWNPDITTKKSPLWPYCGNSLDIWRCPGDAIYSCRVTSGSRQGQYSRVRSYSMNDWFNGADASGYGSGFKIYLKLGDCLKPGPAMTFVFAHERVDSINDGEFIVSMSGYPSQPTAWRFMDLPINQHDGACGFSFVDGHSEMHSWQDVLVTIPLGHGPVANAPNSKDAYWLMDHSTRKP